MPAHVYVEIRSHVSSFDSIGLDLRQKGENMYDLKELFAIGLGADPAGCNVHELELFLLKWEHVIIGMNKPPDSDAQ